MKRGVLRSALLRRKSDDGVSLIFAMAFVVGVGLVVLTLLTYTGTSLRSTTVTAGTAAKTYDVNNAMKLAVNDIRNSTYDNKPGEACLGGGKAYPASNGSSVNLLVACDPGPGTGAAGGLVPINNSNKPGLALLTLGDGAGGEIGLLNRKNNVLYVHGGMYSNSTIESSGGSQNCTSWTPTNPTGNCNEIYNDIAEIYAESTCTGNIQSAVGVYCGTLATPLAHKSAGDDPGYAAPASDVINGTGITYQSVPDATKAASCPNKVVEFSPGLYDDAAALSGWTNGKSRKCQGKTLLFKPGVYYFDFRDADATITKTGANKLSDEWVVNDSAVNIVGGTPGTNWNGGSPVNWPGVCTSPLEKADPKTGVMFVFGGDSRVAMTRGNMEICGQWFTNQPFFSMFGTAKTTGTALKGPYTLQPLGNANNVTQSPNNSFGNGLKASDLAPPSDNKVATWRQNQNASASLSLDVLTDPTAALTTAPLRAVLSKATLTVRHQDNASWKPATDKITALITLNPKSNASSAVSLPVNLTIRPGAGYLNDAQDVTAALSYALYTAGIVDTAAVASVKLTMSPGNQTSGAQTDVDWVTLSLSWHDVGIRGQLEQVAGAPNCVSLAPITATGACAMLSTDSSQSQRLYLSGTFYAPKAGIQIFLNGVSGQVFRSGLIARTVQLQITASNDFAGPVIQVPDNLLKPKDLDVYLSAYSCPSGIATPDNTCVLVGTSQVTIADNGFAVAAGDRLVTVKSWRVF